MAARSQSGLPTTIYPDAAHHHHHHDLLDSVHNSISTPIAHGFPNLDPRLGAFDTVANNALPSAHDLQDASIQDISSQYAVQDTSIADEEAEDMQGMHDLQDVQDMQDMRTTTTVAQSTPDVAVATQDLGQPDAYASSTLEDLLEYLQTFAKDHGFALVRSSLRRRDQDGKPTRLNLLCDRHGHLRNHRGLTDETRVRKKRTSRGVGCPYRIAVTLTKDEEQTESEAVQSLRRAVQFPPPEAERRAGFNEHDVHMPPGTTILPAPPSAPTAQETYRFKISSGLHNHNPAVAAAHWKHRQLGPAEMKKIRAWYVEKKTPKDMLECLKKENPGSLYVLKDVQNARAKARLQFLEYLEGGPPTTPPSSTSKSR